VDIIVALPNVPSLFCSTVICQRQLICQERPVIQPSVVHGV